MKRSAFPVLMEILVMVLTFSVAAAVCLGLFVAADRISRESEQLDRAVLAAQNAAQMLKAGHSYGDTDQDGLYVTAQDLPEEIPGLCKARIRVLDARGEEIYTLIVGWQEVDR